MAIAQTDQWGEQALSAEIVNQALIVLKEGTVVDPLHPHRFVVPPGAIGVH